MAVAIKELKEARAAMEQRIDGEKKQFQKIMQQNAEEKRRLEEKLKEQKARVTTLLHEFR
jgi:hypothetical protein